MIKFTIPHRLMGLNEYTALNRSNRFAGSTAKANEQQTIALYIPRLKAPLSKPVHILFEWSEGKKPRDKDNIAFAKKFILDALVDKGVLKDDGWRYVESFADTFKRGNDSVTITITEA